MPAELAGKVCGAGCRGAAARDRGFVISVLGLLLSLNIQLSDSILHLNFQRGGRSSR